MGLPQPTATLAPSATPASNTPVATATPSASGSSKPIKQFGLARTDAGESIPAPKPLGIDLVELNKSIYKVMADAAVAANTTIELFKDACALDKPSVPGHKEGRIAYATANMVIQVAKANGLLTKERGAGGFAKMKQDIAKKDDALAKLKAKLIALGQDVSEFE